MAFHTHTSAPSPFDVEPASNTEVERKHKHPRQNCGRALEIENVAVARDNTKMVRLGVGLDHPLVGAGERSYAVYTALRLFRSELIAPEVTQVKNDVLVA